MKLSSHPSIAGLYGLGQQSNMDMFYILVQHHPIYAVLIPYKQELNI